MSKPIHPVLMMRRAIHRSINFLKPEQTDAAIARHVKPLLDALEGCHCIPSDDGPRCGQGGDAEFCPVCRLLAAWKAKL